MSDPYETWLKTRWLKLTSVEAQIAETAWNECERQKDAEIENLRDDIRAMEEEVALVNAMHGCECEDDIGFVCPMCRRDKAKDAEIERLKADVAYWRAEHDLLRDMYLARGEEASDDSMQ